MATYKRGKVYWFNFWFNGQHISRSTKQGNPRVAKQMEAAFRTQLAKGEVGLHEPKVIPVFYEAMRDFLSWSESEHTAHPSTHKRYLTSSKALLKFFGTVQLDRITSDDVEKFKSMRSKQFKMTRSKSKKKDPKADKTGKVARKLPTVLRPATVNRELACLKAMFNFAIKADVILKNPVSRVKFLPEDNEQTRVLSFDEQQQYLAKTSQPLTDVAVLMLETGMRPEEVYRIRRGNVNVPAGFLFNPFGKTKAARRKIHLTSRASELLARRSKTAMGDFLFPSAHDPNLPMPKVNNSHTQALKASGVRPFRPYDLRHTWATRAAMSGVDLVTLAAMLGHSRIQMVLRYAHPTEQHQADAMRKLEHFTAGEVGYTEVSASTQ